MIFRDESGYLVEQYKDGGDSAVREGLTAICLKEPGNIQYYVKNGWGMRHPLQAPWNNTRNFTKDQLKMLVAGLYAVKRQDLVMAIYENLKGGWFCPNTERDWPGSLKRKWPHAFYRNSVPSTKTVPLWNKASLDQNMTIETKWFDCADLLLPNDWEFLKVAAGLKKPSGFGLWFHKLSLWIHSKSSHYEENQQFAECFVLGTLELYLKVNPRWKLRSEKYWADRNEIEYHNMIVDYFYTEGIKI